MTIWETLVGVFATRGILSGILPGIRGGVKVGEIDPKTMVSKKIGGLYFAGEIIDVDAYTGGYNLQIAWATGKAAGEAAADALLTQ